MPRLQPQPLLLAPLLALASLCLALFALPACAALFPKNSPVVQLTSSTFKREILSIEKPALVAFTAPWCGHCQRLSPEYDRAARSLDGIVKFANIDCDAEENKPACGRYDVKGFPTIMLFPPTKNRVPRPYQGERTAKAMVDYAVGALPHNVKKLNAEDLGTWAAKETTKAKVLLFSNKPTSSPLYKSLALDFRKSMAFAFARGDQAPVQAQARVALGVDIKGEQDLPTLVVFPPVSGTEKPFQKGTFEAYEGKLKYPLLKTWLDGVKEKYAIEDVADPPSKAKAGGKAKTKSKEESESKSKAKSKSAKKPAKSTKESSGEQPLPEGAAYEWKLKDHDKAQKKQAKKQAQKEEAEKQAHREEAKKAPSTADDGTTPPMLSKDRAAQLAEEVKAQQEAVAKAEEAKDKEQEAVEGRSQKGKTDTPTAKEHTSSEGHQKGHEDTPTTDEHTSSEGQHQQVFMEAGETVESESGSESGAEAGDSKPYVYTDAQRIDLDAMNAIFEEAGAYQLADEAVDRVARAAGQVRASAGEAYDRVRQAAAKLAGGDGDGGVDSGAFNTLGKNKGGEEGEGDDAARAPFERKRQSLLSAFERWLAGEHPDWESDYAEDFLAATRDVEDLLRSDPTKAQDLAWESEEWLLGQLLADKEKMDDGQQRLGEGKLQSLDEMIALIQTRLKQRGKDVQGRKEQQAGFGVDAALRAAMGKEGGVDKDGAAKKEANKESKEEAKGHDEL